MTRKELVNKVKTEAALLRKHATKEELERIKIEHLEPANGHCCIYGLATGDCWNTRANELFKLAGIPAAESLASWCEDEKDVKHFLKNETIKGKVEKYCEMKDISNRPFSSIEIYITLHNANNKELTEYLNGKSKTLDIK